MKIGIYDPYLDDLGGGEKYMLTIAECLSKNHDVSIFWDNKEDFHKVKKRFALDLSRVNLHINIFSQKVNFWQKIIKTRNFDVIIVVSDGSIPFVLAKKLFLHIQQPLEKIAVFSWKDKLKLSRITGIFYNSNFTKFYNDKILSTKKSMVIYPPVYIQAKDVKKENVILHVGKFRFYKNGSKDYKKQSVMVEVFKKMVDKKSIKNWKFIFAVSVRVEDEDKFSLLQNQAKGYPIEFFINKTNDELWQLYNKAKIYWHASGYGEDLERHPELAEHFGISTVEAMGAGAVPVVINAGGQKEIVTDGENGILWDTLSQLQKKTKHVIENQTLWNQLSHRARERAKDFSKEKFYQRINALMVY